MSSIIRKSDSSSVIVDLLIMGLECLLKHSSLRYSKINSDASGNNGSYNGSSSTSFSPSSKYDSNINTSSNLSLEELMNHVVKLADPNAGGSVSDVEDKSMYSMENTIDISHILGLLRADGGGSAKHDLLSYPVQVMLASIPSKSCPPPP